MSHWCMCEMHDQAGSPSESSSIRYLEGGGGGVRTGLTGLFDRLFLT